MKKIGQRAQTASKNIAYKSTLEKNEVLLNVADALLLHSKEIITANQKDLIRSQEEGLSDAMIDRLMVNEERIGMIAQQVRDIAKLQDPIGEVIESLDPDNGLKIEKITVPLGVVGIIYESRPNVTVDAFALCLKSGNAVILKGGKEAIETNLAFEVIIQDVLSRCEFDPYIIQVIAATDRETTLKMMQCHESIDVLIPRGSQGLIRTVIENSSIPVIETGSGNCHIYVDKEADWEMACAIIENAKCQRYGVCNACESLVVHQHIAEEFLKMLVSRLPQIEFAVDPELKLVMSGVREAIEEDYGREYLGPMLSVKKVASVDEAICHINKYNTKHSEAIITTNKETSTKFLREVDASTVYVNASTRFTDGFEFGFGAEIGISTQKLHARGPMGLRALTSYKYIVNGDGTIRL